MPINRLLRQLMNDERVIQQLQDSKPIREAAKAAVAAWHKGKGKAEDILDKVRESDTVQKLADKVEEKLKLEEKKK